MGRPLKPRDFLKMEVNSIKIYISPELKSAVKFLITTDKYMFYEVLEISTREN